MEAVNTDYLVGLDVGQAQDYTALTVFERFHQERPILYHLRHLERFKLGTPYPEQVSKVSDIIKMEPLKGRCTLIVDGTGAGRPVVDMFRHARFGAALVAITITGGDNVSQEGWDFRVPKRDLVGILQVLLQTKRLKVAKGLELADTMVQELLNFKVEITTSGHDKYEAWREGSHDDLVLSAAIACWYGERNAHWSVDDIQTTGERSFYQDTRGFMGVAESAGWMRGF